MGALCIPIDSNEDPESMARSFQSKKILPICEKCIQDNPMFISFEQASKDC
jgi:hypothetical protein